jgi:hypothetical protein
MANDTPIKPLINRSQDLTIRWAETGGSLVHCEDTRSFGERPHIIAAFTDDDDLIAWLETNIRDSTHASTNQPKA